MKSIIAAILFIFILQSQVAYARSSESNEIVSVDDISFNTGGKGYFRFSGTWNGERVTNHWATDNEDIKSIIKAAYLQGSKVIMSWSYYSSYWWITAIRTSPQS